MSDTDLPDSAVSDTNLIRSVAEDARPRELLLRNGCGAVGEEVLIAILLRTGTRGANVLELARSVLRAYHNSLAELAQATPEELESLRIPGLGRVKCVELSAALELARRVRRVRDTSAPVLRAEDVAELLSVEVENAAAEHLYVLCLNRKNRLLGRPFLVTKGTVSSSLFSPREMFREAVRLSASAVILAHNHPSGDPSPSSEDLTATREAVAAGKILGIPVLDHVVLGIPAETRLVSIRREGLVAF